MQQKPPVNFLVGSDNTSRPQAAAAVEPPAHTLVSSPDGLSHSENEGSSSVFASNPGQSDRPEHDLRVDAPASTACHALGGIVIPRLCNTGITKYNPPVKRILRAAIDTLEISFKGAIGQPMQTRLAFLKELAQSDDPDKCSLAQIVLGKHLFEVNDTAPRAFSFVLKSPAFYIKVSNGKTMPLTHIQIGSEYLTKTGVEAALKEAEFITRAIGVIEGGARVSRVDLCVDFVPTIPMDGWPDEAWITRAEDIQRFSRDRQFSGWVIGKGNIHVRIYDKLREIYEKSGKAYLIYIWQAQDWEYDEGAYRIEFQIRRPMLVKLGMGNPTALLSNLSGLWQYLTGKWLRLTIPQADDTNRSRWPVHPLWEQLMGADWGMAPTQISRIYKISPIQDQYLFTNGLGALTSFMAREGITDLDEGIAMFFHAADEFHESKGEGLEIYFKRKVRGKGREKSTINNIENSPLIKQFDAAQAEPCPLAKDGDDGDT